MIILGALRRSAWLRQRRLSGRSVRWRRRGRSDLRLPPPLETILSKVDGQILTPDGAVVAVARPAVESSTR